MKRKTIILLVLIILISAVFSCSAYADSPDMSSFSDEELQIIIDAARNELANREIAKNASANGGVINTTLDGWTYDSTYISNDYYDIIESASFKNSIGYTIIIHKIIAKQDASASSTIIATDPSGNVIGKSSDDIVLTKGQYNYFRYSFESDISSATLSAQVKTKTDSFMIGPRNAVEMVQYNNTGDDLYITFKQTADKIGSFSKFKLLFYNGDRIVDSEDGYFSIYAENLNGAGTTDVASIWVYGTQFDRIEYIFEP